jgi:hypothetical protein
MNVLILLFTILSLIVAQNCETTGCAISECCSQVHTSSILTSSTDGAEPLLNTAFPPVDVLAVVLLRTLLHQLLAETALKEMESAQRRDSVVLRISIAGARLITVSYRCGVDFRVKAP